MLDASNNIDKVKKTISHICSSEIWVVGVLFLSALVLRGLGMIYSEISADESTYMVIGREIFRGKMYLVDLWDFKPIGVFLVFGLIQHYIFDSIIVVRLMGLLVMVCTSYLIYRIKLKFGFSYANALLSGLIYILLLSFNKPVYNLNTEILFNFFTIACFYSVFKGKKYQWALLSGFFVGFGFIIKYVTLFDAMAIYLFLVIAPKMYNRTDTGKEIVSYLIWAFVGFVIPFGLINLYYIINGEYDNYLMATYMVSKVYGDRINLHREVLYFNDFTFSILPIAILFYFSVFKMLGQIGRMKTIGFFALLWFVIDWIPIILQGKHFAHYYIQAFLPVSVFALDGFQLLPKNRFRKWLLNIVAFLIIVYTGYSFIEQAKCYVQRTNDLEHLESYMKPLLNEEDMIYSNMQSVYYVLDKVPLSKIIHQSIITDESHQKATFFDVKQELENVFRYDPRYIILKKEVKVHNYVLEQIENRYKFEDEVNDTYRIFKIRN